MATMHSINHYVSYPKKEIHHIPIWVFLCLLFIKPCPPKGTDRGKHLGITISITTGLAGARENITI